MLKKKNVGQFSKKYFTQKFVTTGNLSKIWVWNPGSEIRDPEKTYSGSRIRIHNTDFIVMSSFFDSDLYTHGFCISFALLDPGPYWEMQIPIRIYLVPTSISGCRVQFRFEKLIFYPNYLKFLQYHT
jgi:hypothetical protein